MLIASKITVVYYPQQSAFRIEAQDFKEIEGYYRMSKEELKLILKGDDCVLPVVSNATGEVVDYIQLPNQDFKTAILQTLN